MIRAVTAAAALCIAPAVAAGQDSLTADRAAVVPGPHASALWAAAPPDTTRPKAIDLSSGYYTRLTIHRIASYTALPLFAGEFLLGERLLGSTPAPSWVKPAHSGVALALGGLFAVNTVTGAWNLWEARRQPAGRTRRIVHTVLMLAADAGFVYTASLAGGAKRFEDGQPVSGSAEGARMHRNAAIVSLGLASFSTVMMWLWKG